MSWRPDANGETITIRGGIVGRDARGRPRYADGVEVAHCVVSPAGDQVVKGDGFVHGDITKLQVLAPAGTKVADGDVVVIRGEEFIVSERKSFDYGRGRRPVLARHRPKVIFHVERGEVSGGVA